MEARRRHTPLWLVLAFAWVAASRSASADVAMQGVAGVYGNIRAVALSQDHLYVGGDFELAGPPAGGWVTIDPATGQTISTPVRVAGEVDVAVADGNGGWFLGGAITGANGAARSGLVHLLADGTLSPWAPVADGRVRALALSGDVLFVGGDFVTLNGQPRLKLAALDAHTGAALAWTADINGTVTALELDGDTLFVGGTFNFIDSLERFPPVAVRASTGTVLAWDAHVTSSGGPAAITTLVRDDSRLYFGGSFDHVGALAQTGFGAVEIATAAAVAAPKVIANQIADIEVLGGKVYVSGFLSGADSSSRPGILALARGSLALTSWSPSGFDSVEPVASITALGDRIFAAVANSKPGYGARWAVLDTLSGGALALSPELVADLPPKVLRADDAHILAGGTFYLARGQQRRGLVELDLATGLLTSRDLSTLTPGAVTHLEVIGDQLYVAHDSATPGDRLYAIDLTGGTRTSWNPVPDGSISDLIADSGRLFATGGFTHIGAVPRSRVCELDPVSGAPTSWAPGLDGDGEALAAGVGRLYVSGTFHAIDGASRPGLAAFSLDDMSLTPFAPVVSPGPVDQMCVAGQDLVIGGDITQVAGQQRTQLAAVDAASGAVRNWFPISTNNWLTPLQDLRVTPDGVLVAGELITNQATDPQLFLGQVGSPLTLYPIAPDGPVQCLGGHDGVLVLGGRFHSLGPVASAGVGIIVSPNTGAPTPPTPQARALVVWPDPARESVSLRVRVGGPSPLQLEIVDLAGRRERLLSTSHATADDLTWDLRDDRGDRLGPGVHFAIARRDGRIEAVSRFVVVR